MEVASGGDGLELKADPSTSPKSIRILLVAICVLGVLVGGASLDREGWGELVGMS